MRITDELLKHKNKKNAEFILKLTPTLKIEEIIGLKNPETRIIAKRYLNEDECKIFLNSLPHKYHDENMLHSCLISEMKDYQECINELNKFLPYVNNWMVSDIISPKKAFKKNKDLLIKVIDKWIHSNKPYTIRVGLQLLMNFYLDDDFKKDYLIYPSKIRSNEYYVNMMIAWFFATALTKQYDATIPYIKNMKLDAWTHNKTIQKTIESYRISDTQKEYLRTLKIKKR